MTGRPFDDEAPRDWPESAQGAAGEVPTPPLSREQAQALRARDPTVSPWRLVAAQGLAGMLCALLAWGFSGKPGTGWSALYGAAAIVLPSALLVRGMRRGAGSAVASAASFLFWEMVKIVVAIAMLAVATRVVPELSWPALLVAMLACMQVNWLALVWRGRKSPNKS